MSKIIVIGGEPCTGKTTLVKKIIKDFGVEFTPIRVEGLLDCLYNEEKSIFVLGKYEESDNVFQGTDRLSMAVQPSAVKFFDTLKEGSTVIFEGDRLFNNKFLNYLQEKFEDNLRIIVLRVSEQTLDSRHLSRNDNQTDKFKASRKTKVNNILTNLDLRENIVLMNNETPEDTNSVLDHIQKFVTLTNDLTNWSE